MPHNLDVWLGLIAKAAPVAFASASLLGALGSWWAARKSWLRAMAKSAESLEYIEASIAEVERLKADVASIEDADKRIEAIRTLNDFAAKFDKHKQEIENISNSLRRKRSFFWPARPKFPIAGDAPNEQQSAGKRASIRWAALLFESLANRELPTQETKFRHANGEAGGEIK
ncbi:hypothetical protein R70006_04548 [Paraburkholderia domus]|jgi:hypothetical protein|uniref:hypothetical protein n=1 Tax=Paraburkholderia domus TaxID=2793075 RepID=UPI0019120C27|nr:hypothetical protein [Paraburkholderia domus]MBK5047142.1 hypothetical protein [Burkholderia sp. R-70006]CAE6784146.1 hypothetical protein R70006_04548 [Paraburkholderia domus]